MIQNVLSGIGGVGVYGVISICLFFAVFTCVLLWTISLKKPYLNAMRELPLEDSAPDSHPNLNAQPENTHDRG